jgi:tetratricopeptide (TPR) repeat protein
MTRTTRPHPLRTSLSLAVTLALMSTVAGSSGCKKDDETTEPEPATAGAEEGEPEPEPETQPQAPEQDPDPAELSPAMEKFLAGHYAEMLSTVEPIAANATEDSQIRARAIASSLVALAHAQDLPENAATPSDGALEAAKLLLGSDAEVDQLARIARGSYHKELMEYDEAHSLLSEAVELDGPHGSLARIMLAESLLGQAFDEEERLAFPEKLDEAGAAYQAVLDANPSEILRARALEGLAGVGNYKKDKEATCTNADAASTAYEAAGASDYLREGPSLLAQKWRCK